MSVGDGREKRSVNTELSHTRENDLYVKLIISPLNSRVSRVIFQIPNMISLKGDILRISQRGLVGLSIWNWLVRSGACWRCSAGSQELSAVLYSFHLTK